MLMKQIKIILQKPSLQIKIALITALLIAALIEQIDITTGYISSTYMNQGSMTVLVLLMHILSYYDFYQSILFVGFILLIPDIVKGDYLEKKELLCYGSRIKCARYAIEKIVIFSALYVFWFLFVAIIVGGIGLHNFSLEWPKFVEVMQRQIARLGVGANALLNFPIGIIDYPEPVVFLLMVIRCILGFSFLGLFAGFITYVTKKVRNGIGSIIILAAISCYVRLDMGGVFYYWNNLKSEGQRKSALYLSKYTIQPLFTACKIDDSFMPWMKYGIVAGIVLCILAAIGILFYYKKGDLGDADRDE